MAIAFRRTPHLGKVNRLGFSTLDFHTGEPNGQSMLALRRDNGASYWVVRQRHHRKG